MAKDYIEELPCPHFSELSNNDQFRIMCCANELHDLMNEGREDEFDWAKYYPNPTIAQQEFIDNCVHIIKQDPDLVLDASAVELDVDEFGMDDLYEDLKALREEEEAKNKK